MNFCFIFILENLLLKIEPSGITPFFFTKFFGFGVEEFSPFSRGYARAYIMILWPKCWNTTLVLFIEINIDNRLSFLPGTALEPHISYFKFRIFIKVDPFLNHGMIYSSIRRNWHSRGFAYSSWGGRRNIVPHGKIVVENWCYLPGVYYTFGKESDNQEILSKNYEKVNFA